MMKNLYYTSRQLNATATVVSVEFVNSVPTVRLDQTVFHAQGGGQKSDTGRMGAARVLHAAKDPEGVVHTVDRADGLEPGITVDLAVDAAPRLLHSRLHTAGHLLAAVIEQMVGGAKGVRGHHWPGESRVDFDVPGGWGPPEGFHEAINAKIEEAIKADLGVLLEELPEGRRVTIAGFAAMPCGGTHVSTLGEIGSVLIRKVTLKSQQLRIGYDVR